MYQNHKNVIHQLLKKGLCHEMYKMFFCRNLKSLQIEKCYFFEQSNVFFVPRNRRDNTYSVECSITCNRVYAANIHVLLLA